MRLRWDWLGPTVTVPFVPTLGPVHPHAVGPDLFADVLNVAGTDRFLQHDKDRRWFGAQTERVLVEGIVHEPDGTWFPVLSRRGAGSVSVVVYGGPADGRGRARRLASELRSTHGVGTASVVWFTGLAGPRPAGARATSVQFQEFGPERGAKPAPPSVHLLDECAVKATFAGFARAMAREGFAFLHRRIIACRTGPVLVAVEEGEIVGAIGPMEIGTDAVGAARLLPPYLGVLPGRRGQGHGRALWRAAVRWGRQNGAAYQLVQTEVGGASEHLCRTEGLRSLGLVCRMPVDP